jgi:hypothetical protein
MFRRLAAALLVSLLVVVGPAVADHFQSSTERLVRWTGCTAPVHTSDAVSVLNSFYAPSDSMFGERGLYIGTKKDTPDYVQIMVTLHEAGHCLQHQAGILYVTDTVTLELDADRYAADLACSLGLDGRGLLHDLFVWAFRVYGYDGDPRHGTMVERIHAGDLASRCHAPAEQAPFMSSAR